MRTSRHKSDRVQTIENRHKDAAHRSAILQFLPQKAITPRNLWLTMFFCIVVTAALVHLSGDDPLGVSADAETRVWTNAANTVRGKAVAPALRDSFYFYDPPANDALVRAKRELADLKARGTGSGPWPGVEPYYLAESGKYFRESRWKELHPNSALPQPRYRSGSDWVTEDDFNKTAYAYSIALAEVAVEQATSKQSPALVRSGWRREIITNVVEPCLDVATHHSAPSTSDQRAFKILLRYQNKQEQERLVDTMIPKVRNLARSERAVLYEEMRRECFAGVSGTGYRRD